MPLHGSSNKPKFPRDSFGNNDPPRSKSLRSMFDFPSLARSLARHQDLTDTATSPTSSCPEIRIEESRGEQGSPPNHWDGRIKDSDSVCSSVALVDDVEYQRLPHLVPEVFEVSIDVAKKWVSGWPQDEYESPDSTSKMTRYDCSAYQLRSMKNKRRSVRPRGNPDTGKGGFQPAGDHKTPSHAIWHNIQRPTQKPRRQTNPMNEPMLEAADNPSLWRTSTDPKSGKTYYYNEETRETQWRKPLCLATEAERQEAARQEKQTRDFFAAMEVNIRKSMISGADLPQVDSAASDSQVESVISPRPLEVGALVIERPDLVRTISTMEDSVLADLIQRVPSHRIINNRSEDSMRGLDPVVESPPTSPFAVAGNQIPTKVESEKNLSQRSICMNSGLRGSMTRILIGPEARMNLVPEGENEDASSSHHDHGEEAATRGLQRSQGTLSLNYTEDEDDEDHNSKDEEETKSANKPRVRFHGDDSLEAFYNVTASARTLWLEDGEASSRSIQLDGTQQSPSNAVPRENSFSLLSLASDRSLHSANSISQFNRAFRRQESAEWPSLFRQSSTIGLSDNEGDAMFTLAAITQEMGSITPFSSTSSVSDPPFDGVSLNSADSSDLSEDDDDDNIKRPKLFKRPHSVREKPSEIKMKKPTVQRRNTCGTLYVGSTMAAPDIEATIKCVCGVFRAHILLSDEITSDSRQHLTFNDLKSHRHTSATGLDSATVPPLGEITSFYRDIFNRAKMEPDCIIISLIYVERLIKATNGSLRPRPSNWRSVLFSCMVMSSKVWDDLSMWNSDFSQTCPPGMELTLQRVNELELSVLDALEYRVKVPASEYAKYYFLLRSMLLKSGLGSEDLNTMNPLDVEGAKELQRASSAFQSNATKKKSKMARSQTTTGVMSAATPNRVGLEHFVQL